MSICGLLPPCFFCLFIISASSALSAVTPSVATEPHWGIRGEILAFSAEGESRSVASSAGSPSPLVSLVNSGVRTFRCRVGQASFAETAPLERDEGEYAYAGQLMLQGIPPYQLAYNMKLPGTYAA